MKKKILLILLLVCIMTMGVVLTGCKTDMSIKNHYTIKQIDLSEKPSGLDSKYDSLFGYNIIDDQKDYMAHPDSVLLDDDQTILTFYPGGHGKGEIYAKKSTDGGLTWSERLTNLPASWANSQETPTVYKLDFNDGGLKYVLVSANPNWNKGLGDGFNASISNDGYTWSDFQKFYGKDANGKKDENFVAPIVAMASLTRLKDANGNWRDAWMGFFHDDYAYNYKTILTFDENGNMQWSKPEKYLSNYRKIEKAAFLCEVEVIRSEQGQGNQLLLIGRSNGKNGSKPMNSLVSISNDEGVTWSEPKEAPMAYNGERHKAEWLKDGRLFITFRSIDRSPEKLATSYEKKGFGKGKWFSEGWIAWVGTYNNLVNGEEGEYRIKLAHTYLEGQTQPQMSANGDTGYCGNVVMPNGKIMTSTYGIFNPNSSKTFIACKVIDINLIDEIIKANLM